MGFVLTVEVIPLDSVCLCGRTLFASTGHVPFGSATKCWEGQSFLLRLSVTVPASCWRIVGMPGDLGMNGGSEAPRQSGPGCSNTTVPELFVSSVGRVVNLTRLAPACTCDCPSVWNKPKQLFTFSYFSLLTEELFDSQSSDNKRWSFLCVLFFFSFFYITELSLLSVLII